MTASSTTNASPATQGQIHELTNTRRFYRDEHHAYGWQIGFRTTLTDGVHKKRIHISDIGTDRRAALNNGLRMVENYRLGIYSLATK